MFLRIFDSNFTAIRAVKCWKKDSVTGSRLLKMDFKNNEDSSNKIVFDDETHFRDGLVNGRNFRLQKIHE